MARRPSRASRPATPPPTITTSIGAPYTVEYSRDEALRGLVVVIRSSPRDRPQLRPMDHDASPPSVVGMNQPTDPKVLIVGGGVAALETLLALREIGVERAAITLVAPDTAFSYRPMKVAEPFALGHAAEHDLAAIAAEFDATFLRDTVAKVRADRHEVLCTSGDTLAYDHLVLATGAKAGRAFEHAITFGEDPGEERLHGMLADL